ncbi:P-loop containing nucleoside triphosphate hydrolase protein [Mycena haematopus]|nr:P-loop containing nucleoside triphosphate hydrolase protein [Mycena haematopus]
MSSKNTKPGIRRSKSKAKRNWIGPLLQVARAFHENAPFPYVKCISAVVVLLLETVEKVKRNRDDLEDLCKNVVQIMEIVESHLSSDKEISSEKLAEFCKGFEEFLQGVLDKIVEWGTGLWIMRVLGAINIADKIAEYQKDINEFRLNFIMIATSGLYHHLHIQPPSSPGATDWVNNCPPPSRIFHGRQDILERLQQYFSGVITEQRIYVLYGLGGIGKTQIVLKFIQQSRTHFSDIFLIDASTPSTIDASLKNISELKGVGNTSKDTFRWLCSQQQQWLLLFDKADDPNLPLNDFLPKCNHGNIIITSRNPELRTYGDHTAISDMDETEAIDLLLKCAVQDNTPHNRKISGQILSCLPLALIQAGAFIAKSRDLDGYLVCFHKNRKRLLSERSAQTHDDYGSTVYTTWQISFDRLSLPAAMLLQLFSFLHSDGISEEIFSRASKQLACSAGPFQAGLQNPLDFLKQFLDPTGSWDETRFLNLTNELQSYSLITFNALKTFSIHPLVHEWSRNTVTEPEAYRSCIIAILGMSILDISSTEIQHASLRLLPHADALLHEETNIAPDIKEAYGRVYYTMGQAKKAEQLYSGALDNRRRTLGEDHLQTLMVMTHLAATYRKLGKLEEAEKLQILTLDKLKKMWGDAHPDTLQAAASLAVIYQKLGKLREAEELQVVVVEKLHELMGPEHPDTLKTMAATAITYQKLGKLREAKQLRIEILEKRKKLLGEDHISTVTAMNRLAMTYHGLDQFEQAERLAVSVLAKRRKLLGEDHPDTVEVMKNLALVYHASGKHTEATNMESLIKH